MEARQSLELFNQTLQRVDFRLMKRKMMSPLHGEGWTEEHVNYVEREYRRFLALIAAYPGQEIVPSKEIDTFWHYHILDTRCYAQDMMLLFGEVIHHYPYFGMDDESDDAMLETAFAQTKALYRELFDEPMVGFAAACTGNGSSCAGRCRN